MKRAFLILLLCTIVALVLIPVSSSTEFRAVNVIEELNHGSTKVGSYRALIIGINEYKDPKIPDLETPLNDSRALADLLQEKYGFVVETIFGKQATRKTIYNNLRGLSSKAKPNDSVLIYYAGHGDLDRQYNDGWWIPFDATVGDPTTYLDNVQVQKAMRSMKAKHVLLISDSCYSGTLFGQSRAMPPVIDNKYYLGLYNEKSRWGMTSGNKTPVADDGTGGHSVFAYQFIKELKNNEKPYLSTQEIYTRIAPIVSNNSEQTPLCRPMRNTGDQGGEFIFIASVGKKTYQQKSQKSLDVPEPINKGASFDDIIKAGKEKEKIKSRWSAWQDARNNEFIQAKNIDKNIHIYTNQKKEAWQRFVSVVSQNNPYSTRDDEMRAFASERIAFWDGQQSNNVKETKIASINPSMTKPTNYNKVWQQFKYDNLLKTSFANVRLNEQFKIGTSLAVTGPTSDQGSPYSKGLKDYFRYINDNNLMGNNKIEFIMRDDGYRTEVTKRNFEYLLGQGIILYLNYSTGSTLVLRKYFEEEQIPVISYSLHSGNLLNSNYIFLPIASYSQQMIGLADYVSKHHKSGTARIALFIHPSTFGRITRDDLKKAISEGLNVDIVEIVEHGSDLDNTSMLKRFMKKNVQYVISHTIQHPVATMLKSAKELDILSRSFGEYGKLTFLGALYTGGSQLISLAGPAAENFHWINSIKFMPNDKNDPNFKSSLAIRYGREKKIASSYSYTMGVFVAQIAVEAIRRVVTKGKDVTRKTLHTELNNMNGNNSFFPNTSVGPVNFSNQDRTGVETMQLYKVKNNIFIPVGNSFLSSYAK
jgi:branched-chain amino acid transport system substrate-binding protein